MGSLQNKQHFQFSIFHSFCVGLIRGIMRAFFSPTTALTTKLNLFICKFLAHSSRVNGSVQYETKIYNKFIELEWNVLMKRL